MEAREDQESRPTDGVPRKPETVSNKNKQNRKSWRNKRKGTDLSCNWGHLDETSGMAMCICKTRDSLEISRTRMYGSPLLLSVLEVERIIHVICPLKSEVLSVYKYGERSCSSESRVRQREQCRLEQGSPVLHLQEPILLCPSRTNRKV